MVATLILSRGGVKLGLARGSELPDPKHLLAGSGKVHRHIAFTEGCGCDVAEAKSHWSHCQR